MYIEQVLSVIEEIDSEAAEEFKKGIEGETFTLPDYGLMHAFQWVSSRKGFDYWYELDKRITEYLKGSSLEASYPSLDS